MSIRDMSIDARFEKIYISLVLGCFAAFGILFAIVTPFNQAPDEAAHAAYIVSLARTLTFPDATLTAGSRFRNRIQDPEVHNLKAALVEELPSFHEQQEYIQDDRGFFQEFYQPPLYYMLAAPVYALGDKILGEAWYIPVRLLSLLWGLLTIFLIYLIAKKVFGAGFLTLIIPTLAVSFPMVTYISGVINNDSLTNFLAALIVFLGLIILNASKNDVSRYSALAGFVMALAYLTKGNLLAFIAVLGVVIAVRIQNLRVGLRPLLLAVSIFLVMTSPWIARNLFLYHDALGFSQIRPEFFPEQRATVLTVVSATDWVKDVFQSFVGTFGHLNIPLDSDIYSFFKILFVLGAFGFFTYLIRMRDAMHIPRKSFMLLGAVLFFTLVELVVFNLRFYQPQGRYLFPALTSIALFIGVGLFELLPPRFHASLLLSLFLTALFTNIAGLLSIISYTP